MMKRIALFLALVLLFSLSTPVIGAAPMELIYLPTADSYVSLSQPDTNYGEDAAAKIAVYSTNVRNIPYYSFDFTEERHDDIKFNEDLMSNNGIWYSFDVTATVKQYWSRTKRELHTALWIPWEANTDYSGTFATKESALNLPHLKITCSSDGKNVVKAVIYLFGGTISPTVELYETTGAFDEQTITYMKRPALRTKIGIGKKEQEMSGNVVDEAVVNSYEGKSIGTLTQTGMDKFETVVPDYPTWDEIYDARQVPSVEKLEEDYHKALPTKGHPRIYGNQADWERVRVLAEQGQEAILKWKETILSAAEIAVARGVPTYYIRSTGDIDQRGSDIGTLGMAYQLTKDKRYSDACYAHLKAVAEYPDWNNGGAAQLNLGDCCLNVGLGYDLIYETMTEAQKKDIVSGALKNGLYIMQGAPNTGTNNWNPVINGGAAVLACALLDEETDVCLEIVRQSIANIPIALLEYYPDGGFPEGPSYWAYMLDNFANFLAAVNYTFGQDYGVGDFQGISTTGFYPIYLQGPTPTIRFKYGDDRTKYIASKSLFYLARRFDAPVFAKYQLDLAETLNDFSTIAPYWYCEDTLFDNTVSVYDTLDKDKTFDGQSPIGTMRSNWEDENALFAGFKAGFPQTSHADMDIGTFTFAANGIEWGCDLQSVGGDYSRPGYYSLFRHTRYLYYERSVQGHNTLLFDPGRTYPAIEFGQEPNSYSTIEKAEFTQGQAPYVIMDISDAYRRYATKVRRGISLINNRREFLVQDEIWSEGNHTVYWSMHTKADVEVNGDEAILTQGDKRLYCKILSPGNASFDVMDAKPLPMTATTGGYDQRTSQDYQKLYVKCDYENRTTLSIWMVPLTWGDDIPTSTPQMKRLDNWPLEQKENVTIDGIQINGNPLEGFKPDKYVYNYISGSADFDYKVICSDETVDVKTEYSQGYLRILCKDKTGKKSDTRYLISATKKAEESKYKVEASYVPQPENAPSMTMDGDLGTRFATEGEQWIQYDLEEVKEMDSISLAFYMGASRRYNMGIHLSEDGENYTTVFEGKTSGTTENLERYTFDKQQARYIKITLNGNNENDWGNLSEIAFEFIEDSLALADEEE